MMICALRKCALRYHGEPRCWKSSVTATRVLCSDEVLNALFEGFAKVAMDIHEEQISNKHKLPSKKFIFATVFQVKIPKSAEFKRFIKEGLLMNKIDDADDAQAAIPLLHPINLKAVSKKEVVLDPQAKILFEGIERIYDVLRPELEFTFEETGKHLELIFRDWLQIRIAASVGFPKEPMTMARLLGIDGALEAQNPRDPLQLLESITSRLNSVIKLPSNDMIASTTIQHSSREVSDRAAFIAELEKVPVDRRQPIAFIRPHSDPLKKGEFWGLCLKVRYTPATVTTQEVEEEEEEKGEKGWKSTKTKVRTKTTKAKKPTHYYIFVDNKSTSEWCESTTRDVAPPLRRLVMRSLENDHDSFPPTEHQHLGEVFRGDGTTTGGRLSTGGGIEYVYLYMGDINYYSKVIDTHAMLIGGDYVGNFYGQMHDFYELFFKQFSRAHFRRVNNPNPANEDLGGKEGE